MFAKKLSRNCKKWVILQRFDSRIEKVSSANSNNNKLCHASRGLSFNRDKYFVKRDASRRLHTCVNLMSLEIKYAHNVLQSSEAYPNCLVNSLTAKQVQIIEVQQLIAKPWIAMSNKELLENFEHLSLYAHKNCESISDSKYDTVIEAVMEKCIYFNNEKLMNLLSCLELWSSESNWISPSMQKIAVIVDKEFLNRLSQLTVDEIFLINDHFYRLNFLRLSQFTVKSLRSLNFGHLSRSNLMHLMFFMKVNKRIGISLNANEHHIWKHFDEFTMTELGILAMAFFKNETKIQDKQRLLKIMQKLKNNIDTVNDITLNACLKILRYSVTLNLLEHFTDLLLSLADQVPHRTLETITQIAHVQASSIVHNRQIILKILERYKQEIGQARLKDIERIAFVLYTFNYDPETTHFYSDATKELLNPKRAEEIKRFPKSAVYTLMYITQVNYYSEETLSYFMSREFIEKLSQGNWNKLNREYLILDYCLEIDHPEYRGPRIEKNLLEHLKKHGVFYKNPKSEIVKVDQLHKLIIDVIHVLQNLLGSQSAIHVDFLLPHVSRDYIILCYDQKLKKYISPAKQLSRIQLGSIKYAPKDGNTWYAIVIGSHNILTRDTTMPTGILAMQMRHLERIGYKPILIKYNQWKNFRNEKSRRAYLSTRLPLC
ncbi:FAST kinase domain-containing protein 5, mitochondrial-like [Copidosoma floridanum]|uniref:FAST kinase domain-containing protein 5, mitochondrial-like n=1 Tax=Copidosoma floridanum TaxID=29053 RepID=UPI0006C9D649|nr:FAST kinase domain-containing protein 5, mitochondrial-like [Copidosoma floridanum]